MKSLRFYGRTFAMLNAVARETEKPLSVKLLDRAYSAYVEGRTSDLKAVCRDARKTLGLSPKQTREAWRKLPKTAKRETNRLAFKR